MSNMENKQPETVEEVQECAYTLRRLKDKDLYPVLSILGKVLPEDIAPIIKDIVTQEKDIKEVGAVVLFKIVTAILRNIPAVHEELYGLLSDLSGIPAAEIEEMEFGTTPAMLWDVVSDAKNTSFFKGVSKLL
jgi:hypothetical protein